VNRGSRGTVIPLLWNRTCSTQPCGIAQMFVTPRIYALSQVPDKGLQHDIHSTFGSVKSWKHSVNDYQEAAEMLLLHQTGSVRIGQVVRYCTIC